MSGCGFEWAGVSKSVRPFVYVEREREYRFDAIEFIDAYLLWIQV